MPFDRSQNACGQFYQGAIEDRVEKKVEAEKKGEDISLEEQEQNNFVQVVWASLQPKYRNQGQASSSSNSAAEVRNEAGPTSRGQRSEPQVPVQKATEPVDSGSDQTEQPPSTDISSADQNPLFSEADLADLEDQPAPDVASGAIPQDK